MVIDSSALVAILFSEPERVWFQRTILAAQTKLLSAITALETSLVIERRLGVDAKHDLERIIQTAGIEIVPFEARHYIVARRAWERFGKGRHRAGLNLGDCCTYALASLTGQPLLAKGNHFVHTDLEIIQPPS